MSSREDFGWHDDRPCPGWCVIGAEHVDFQLRTGGEFWHEGVPVELATTDTDYNHVPVPIPVKIVQREQVDERGHIRHPAEVSFREGTLTPVQARELADALVQMATAAEMAPNDIPQGRAG